MQTLQEWFKFALGSLLRNRLYALLNIVGLSVGIAAFTVLFLLFIHETQYDNFHPHLRYLYRITEEIKQSGIGEHALVFLFRWVLPWQQNIRI